MINNNDVQISKMSFTDKDFASIYPDLLDLAKTLTNEWNPGRGTNESDPGVVLLKEGAFIADHNNYNIDKNILEAFLPSATQDRSVRNITEMNGYVPRYYVSAVGDITFEYEPEDEEDTENFKSFAIPAYTMVITDEKENYAYTQISDLNIHKNGTVSTCLFMEGTLQQLEINTDKRVTLENLDENNRLYLPNVYIPQNGIFIKNYGDSNNIKNELWERNNYLLTQPLGSKIYKFDYDSTVNLPYIEFPSDIANLIENGLDVKYMTTTGVNGNVDANTLTKILSPTTYDVGTETTPRVIKMENFSVNNMSSLKNGKNPETINEMYRSFKKIVGTFDTLVTCRDYSNAIYNLVDEYDNPIISNGVVTDIRNDYNHALNVISYDQYGEYFENIPISKGVTKYNFITNPNDSSYVPKLGDIIFVTNVGFKVYKEVNGENAWEVITDLSYNDFVDASESMSQYDLCIYALKAFSMADYLSSSRSVALNKSFQPVTNDVIDEIKESLHELKCISHEFMGHDSDEVYCFKNYCPLRVTITPYSKISEKAARESLFDNIYQALTEAFNAREVEFGEELNYDEVYDVILNSDDRIKSIRLEDFEYSPVAVKFNPKTGVVTEIPVYESEELLVDLVAKNVLAGRLCLFDFDDNFNYEYGQQSVESYTGITSISTESVIPLNEPVSTVNTSSQTTSVTFPTDASLYIYDPDDVVEWPVAINAGSTYSLPSGASAIVVCSSQDERSYLSSEISTVVIHNLSSNNWTLQDEFDSVSELTPQQLEISQTLTQTTTISNNLNYTVRENEYIQIAFPNYYSTKIYPTYVYYRFFNTATNDESNEAIARANTEYQLGSGEQIVFLYTKDEVQQQDIYGPGTIIRPTFNLYYTSKASQTKVNKTWSYDGISEKTEAFVNLSAGQQIDIREILETELTGANVPCYWIRNNPGNILFEPEDEYVILNSGEYFIYSNSTRDSMVILGAGTKITKPSNDISQWAIGNLNSSTTNISAINNDGFAADIKWQVKDFSGEGNSLKIQEMNIITLGEGNQLIIQGLDLRNSSEIYNNGIDNTWQELVPTSAFKIIYTINNSTSELNYNTSYNYLIRSRLDISVGDLNDQTLLPGQSVTITTFDSSEQHVITSETSSETTKFQASENIDIIGGESINITPYTDNNIDIGLMAYTIVKPTLTTDEFSYVNVTAGELYDDITSSASDVQYYYSVNGSYYKLTVEAFNSLWLANHENEYNNSSAADRAESISSAFGDITVYQATESDPVELEDSDGRYVFPVSGAKGEAKFPLGYNATFDFASETQQQYLLPIFLLTDEGGADITVELTDDDTGESVLIRDYNYSDSDSSIILNKQGMYLINPVIIPESSEASESSEEQNTGKVTISKNLTLTISWNEPAQNTEGIVVLRPRVVNGINENLSYVSLGSVLDRISELLSSSDKYVKPYYIYKPDPDLAIQDENIMNPNIFWDKNNVANIITIPQIDLDNSDFGITKSMLIREKK